MFFSSEDDKKGIYFQTIFDSTTFNSNALLKLGCFVDKKRTYLLVPPILADTGSVLFSSVSLRS